MLRLGDVIYRQCTFFLYLWVSRHLQWQIQNHLKHLCND